MPCCSCGGCFLYYEFYIDQFFLEQVITQGLLLLLTSKAVGRDRSFLRLGAGSVIGAGMMTGFLCAGSFWIGAFCSLMTGSLTISGRKWKDIPGSLAGLLFVTVCFGGTLEAAVEMTGIPVAAGSCGAGFFLWKIWKRGQTRKLQREREAEVTVIWEKRLLTVKGIVDTGNSLREPLGRSPVSILEQKSAEKLLTDGWEERRGFYLIPYRSIGRKQGWMRAFRADEMQIKTQEGVFRIKNPILAISGNGLSGDETYQILLHPQHTRQGIQ